MIFSVSKGQVGNQLSMAFYQSWVPFGLRNGYLTPGKPWISRDAQHRAVFLGLEPRFSSPLPDTSAHIQTAGTAWSWGITHGPI